MAQPEGSAPTRGKADRLLVVALVLLALLTTALLLRASLDAHARMEPAGGIERLTLLGDVSVDGGAAVPLSAGAPLCEAGLHTLTFRGHFARDVLAGEQLMFRIHHLRVRLLVNGAETFSFGQAENRTAFMRSGGSAWQVFDAPAIAVSDEIVLVLENVYRFTVNDAFAMLLCDVQVGSSGGLYRRFFQENGAQLVLALMVIAMSVVCVVLAILIRVWRLPGHQRVACFALFAGVVGLWCLTDSSYPYLSLFFPYPAFITTLDTTCMYLLPAVALVYIRAHLTDSARRTATRGALTSLCCLLVALTLQLAGLVDLYEMQPIIAVVALVLCLDALIRMYRETRGTQGRFALYSFLPAMAASVWSALRFLAHLPGGTAPYRVGMLLTVALQTMTVIAFLRRSAENDQRTKDLQAELDASHISMLQSQIKPHFLYNTLNAISGLCLTDPLRADDAIIHFSEFLRANMNGIEQVTPIPFERELEHTKHYVTLEQLRYGARLRVAWDIGFEDFMLPTLSLQPVVENAIRHGIAPKPEGGTLTITTAQEGDDAVIVVTDDGVGYNPEAPSEKPGMKGLDNVSKRLAFLSRATIRVESALDRGTTVTIRVPLSAEAANGEAREGTRGEARGAARGISRGAANGASRDAARQARTPRRPWFGRGQGA